GLTETSPVITAGLLRDNRVGTAGKPIRNVEVRIAPDGEIETRGPHVMQGYWKKPDETRAVFTADGWFKTGDIGQFDEDGFLTITDRKKELLKTSGGKYIAPQPIEHLIPPPPLPHPPPLPPTPSPSPLPPLLLARPPPHRYAAPNA